MKKTKKLLVVLVALVMVLTVVLSACKVHVCGHKCPICGDCTDPECKDPVCADKCEGHDATYLPIADHRAYAKAELESVKTNIGSISTAIDAKVQAAYEAGIAAIGAASTVKDVQKAFSDAKNAMANEIPLANGVKSFKAASYDVKAQILGKLEQYAVNNGITGITLFENGGYVMYNDRITLGTENYILGYGFGVLSEGRITKDLDSEQTTAWKRYYHTYNPVNPGTANYLDGDDSTVSDFYGYIAGSYYTNFMNAEKDGYDWVPELALRDPEPVGGLSESGQSAKWRFEIRTDLKYSTLGKHKDQFDGLTVQPEDFLTPYKLMFNQANGLFRGGESVNQSGAQYIVGSKEYYEATKDAQKGVDETVDFSKVGVKVYEENGKWYFEYQLGEAVTAFYARYYIASNLYQPIPVSFINAIGGIDNYLGFNENKSDTPVDNSLSLGAYVLERWDDGQVVYKKNPNYVYASSKYQIEGVHINILPAASTDRLAGFREFEAGKIDSSGIPQEKVAELANDPRTRTTMGDFCFKLNVNALSAETWEYMFGTNGVIKQTPKDQYWNVKPLMNNQHFLQGLSFATNRKEFAESKGSIASANFFSSNYLSNPELGTSYNTTEAHKNALSGIVNEDTDEYGYSVELARDYFRMALDEVEAAGLMTPGTKEKPTVIELTCVFYYASFEETMFKPVKQYWEDAFNHDSVSGGKYKLELKFLAPSTTDMAYDMMMEGQFDIGFGGITGNPMDPLDFFDTLSSTPSVSSGWTLNWGCDTANANSDIIVYNGERWSFDALQQAGTTTVVVKDGNIDGSVVLIDAADQTVTASGEDLNVTLVVEYNKEFGVGNVELSDLVLFGGTDDYKAWSLIGGETPILTATVSDDGNGKLTVTFTLPAAEIAKVPESDNQGVDVYVSFVAGGIECEELVSFYIFEKTE